MAPSGAGVEREAEQSWTSGAYVADVEVQGMLYDGAAGVSGAAAGKEPAGNRNSARTWWRRERDSGRRVKAPGVLVWGPQD